MIRLIGPGGAGKTTVGARLARRLGLAFIDLDREFITRAGDIYASLHVRKVATMRPIDDVLDQLNSQLRA